MRGQYIRSARTKTRCNHAHSRPPLCRGVPHIFLTAPFSYVAVAFPLGQGEKLLRYVKLATSSEKASHQTHATGTSIHRIPPSKLSTMVATFSNLLLDY